MTRTLAAFLSFAAILAAQSVVAVVNRGDNTVSLIDPATGSTTKLPTGVGPHEAIACNGRIFVSNYGNQEPAGSSVSVYNAASRKPVGVDVSPLLRPHGVVCAGDFVWFTAEVNMTMGRIRLSDLKNVVTRIAGNEVTTAAAGQQPEAIDVSPDGAQVWAGNRGDNTISVIDTKSMKSVDTIPTAKFVYRICFTPDGKRVLATEPESNALRVYDATTRKLIQSIPIEGLPVSVAIAPGGKLAYVAAAQGAKVHEIDLEKLAVTRAFDTGPGADGVAVL